MFRLSYYQQLSQRIGSMTVRDKYDIDRHDVRLRSLHLHTPGHSTLKPNSKEQ